MKIQTSVFLALAGLVIAPFAVDAITPAMADLVIEKTTQTLVDILDGESEEHGPGRFRADDIENDRDARRFLFLSGRRNQGRRDN